MDSILGTRPLYSHYTVRQVNLDGTHVTYSCACGSMWTDRLENEHTTLSTAYYAHLKVA